jgi:hypothetical protein
MRFGLVAAIATNFSFRMLVLFPSTFHASTFYSSTGYAALAVIAALVLYGFRISLGGPRLFDFYALEDGTRGRS